MRQTVLCRPPEGQQEVYRHGRDVFINEAKILQGLYANPHVVNVLDFFYDNKTAYMVMEYIQGQTINDYMKKKKHTVSIRMANQVCFGRSEKRWSRFTKTCFCTGTSARTIL